MEYIYAAMLLHKAGQQINEASLKKVMDAAGIKADDARIKSLVAVLEGINIDEAIKNASMPMATATHSSSKEEPKQEKKEEKKKEDKVSEEEAAAGLGALFG
ncbi:MAG: 50S ribosomal protein P1 [Candidatus Woesearchaeota archaeon]